MNVIGGFIDEPNSGMILSIIANIISTILIVIALPGIFAGIGLYKRKEWARILTMILSVLEIFSFPFGTVIGIYSIWALNQTENIGHFRKV